MSTDVPVLVVSNAKSRLLPADALVPLKPSTGAVNLCAEENELSIWRLSKVREAEHLQWKRLLKMISDEKTELLVQTLSIDKPRIVMEMREGPEWLQSFINAGGQEGDNYKRCPCASESGKNHMKMFCISCQSLSCETCAKSHRRHGTILEMRKASHRASIALEDIRVVINIKDVQPYVVNGGIVLFLNRPNEKGRPYGKTCINCKRPLLAKSEMIEPGDYKFCCLACKRDYIVNKPEELFTFTFGLAEDPERIEDPIGRVLYYEFDLTTKRVEHPIEKAPLDKFAWGRDLTLGALELFDHGSFI